MRYVLYLNLWGTLEKIREATADDPLFQRNDLVDCQRHFETALALAAQRAPETEVLHFVDSAFAVSKNVVSLTHFANEVFRTILLGEGQTFCFWPVRGAIACDDEPIVFQASDRASSNFRSLPLYGPAPVEAANLEKSAQKGMRLFLTDAAARQSMGLNLRPCSTRGIEHFEANWLTSEFLARSYGEKSVHDHLHATAEILFSRGGNYARQMGASINDLVEWARATK